MEIQNKTSNINTQFQSETKKNDNEISFKNEIQTNNNQQSALDSEDLTYQNIKNMTPEEIDTFYTNRRQNALLTTLNLSTIFSGNSSMNEAMFNMVLSQDNLEDSQSYLYNMMSNRNSYLSNKSNDNGAWLRKNLIEQIDDPTIRNEQIELEKKFQYTMLQFDVVAHMNDMMDFSKRGRDNENGKEDNGLFSMFDNSYLQYQNLFDEYDSIENNNNDLLNHQLSMDRIKALNF